MQGGVALSAVKGVDISDQNEALRRENADLYSQIKALSQRIAQGSAGEIDSHQTCLTVGAFGQGLGLSLTASHGPLVAHLRLAVATAILSPLVVHGTHFAR